MELTISTRCVGDVTILDCVGRLTEYNPFHDAVRTSIAQVGNRLLLNLNEVTYINSTGIGELVVAYTTAKNHGGMLKLVGLTKRIRDLLQVTKLYTVFDVFDSEEMALLSFRSNLLYCICPVCAGRSAPPLLEHGTWPPQRCPHCDARFRVAISQPVAGQLTVESVRIGTYQDEWFEVLSGPPYTILLFGRLSLFSSGALRKTWGAVPAPRRFILELLHATEIDDAGRDELLNIVQEREADAKVAVCLEGLPLEQIARFPSKPPFYADRWAALRALGDVSDTPPWIARIAPVESVP